MFKLICLLVISSLAIVMAEEKISEPHYNIIEINQNERAIVAITRTGSKIGEIRSVFLIVDEKRSCEAQVKKVEDNKIVIDIKQCPFEEYVTIKTKVILPEIGNVEDGGNLSENENWYFYMSAGLSSANYSGDLKTISKNYDDASNERSQASIGLLGFYFPYHKHKSIVGPIVNLNSDFYTFEIAGVKNEASIDQYFIGVSNIYFFGQNIGDKWFIRTDLGMVDYTVENDAKKVKDGAGYGFLLGTGYGIRASRGARLLMSLNATVNFYKGSSSNILAGTVGLLF